MASLTIPAERRQSFILLFLMMLTLAAGNTALQSVLPAIGRTLKLPDLAIALVFAFSALVWALSAPLWARRSDRRGRKRMVVIGLLGFTISTLLVGIGLSAGILGWVAPMTAFVAIILARIIYGHFGAAAPPAAQALVAGWTTRAERTAALTLLSSAFGLGTILGPALAPFLVLPVVGLSGPAYVFALFGLAVTIVMMRRLPADSGVEPARGAAASEPSIGGEPSGATVVAALNTQSGGRLPMRDPRTWPWIFAGIVTGHAQAMTGQAMAFLVMDRLHLTPLAAQPMIGLVLMAGAGAALLAQWGVIPRLGMAPRGMMLWGSLISAGGCLLIAMSASLHALAVSFALASLGFGMTRPGFTAGASLAVGSREQGLVAGRVTSVNGAVFVLGPAIGILLYEVAPPLPYLVAAAALVFTAAYTRLRINPAKA